MVFVGQWLTCCCLHLASFSSLALQNNCKNPNSIFIPLKATHHAADTVKKYFSVRLDRMAQPGQVTPVAIALPEGCRHASDLQLLWTAAQQSLPHFPHRHYPHVEMVLLPVSLSWHPGAYLLEVVCKKTLREAFAIPVAYRPYNKAKLSVPPRFSNPPRARTAKEYAMVHRALAVSADKKLWEGAFERPPRRQTAVFGTQRVYNGHIQSTHLGQDFAGPLGTPIVVSNAGKVAMVANDFFYVGNAVFVDHGLGLFSMYFHMTKTAVQPGQTLHKGDVIGYLGSTGRATGPHLHVSFRLQEFYQDPGSIWQQDWENLDLSHGFTLP